MFYKETQSVLFNKTLAKAIGIPATGFFYLLLFMSGIVITAFLKSIGGLLVFSPKKWKKSKKFFAFIEQI
ncbi:metal ABC transporter permease [bacterium]|nr:metal ABC transporter permease [bacterium]